MFYTLSESRVVIGDWRKKFNQIRPHRSLGMQTPQEFASAQSKPSKAKAGKAA
jgi:transposase InsO family protein